MSSQCLSEDQILSRKESVIKMRIRRSNTVQERECHQNAYQKIKYCPGKKVSSKCVSEDSSHLLVSNLYYCSNLSFLPAQKTIKVHQILCLYKLNHITNNLSHTTMCLRNNAAGLICQTSSLLRGILKAKMTSLNTV